MLIYILTFLHRTFVHLLDQQINQSISTLHTYRTKNILKLYPVKKFTVLIFNSYPNNCHFKGISLASFYRISNV